MFKVRPALAAAALALAIAPASARQESQDNVPRAAPGVLGGTGLLAAPSAYLASGGAVYGFVGGHSDLAAAGVTAGIADRFEVGATWADTPDAAPRAVFNAKAMVLRETLLGPAVAVGVVDAFGQLRREPGFYVVASKFLIPYFAEALTGRGFGVQAHLGFGGGVLGGGSPFGGVEVFPGARGWSALAEVVDGDFNAGLRYHTGPRANGLHATLGLFDGGRRVGGTVGFSAMLPR